MPITRDDNNLTEIRANMAEARLDLSNGTNASGLLDPDGSINGLAVGKAADASATAVCKKTPCD